MLMVPMQLSGPVIRVNGCGPLPLANGPMVTQQAAAQVQGQDFGEGLEGLCEGEYEDTLSLSRRLDILFEGRQKSQ